MELTRKPPTHRRFERTRAARDERGSFFESRTTQQGAVITFTSHRNVWTRPALCACFLSRTTQQGAVTTFTSHRNIWTRPVLCACFLSR